jgi:hypothetical protein
MAAANHNITLEQGAEFRRDITWKNSAGSPVTMTGYVVNMTISQEAGGADKIILTTDEYTANMASGVKTDIITLTEAEGKFEVFISATTTALLTMTDLDWGFYKIDVVPPISVVKTGVDSMTSLSSGTNTFRTTALTHTNLIDNHGFHATDNKTFHVRGLTVNATQNGKYMSDTVTDDSGSAQIAIDTTLDANQYGVALVTMSNDAAGQLFIPDVAKTVRLMSGKVNLKLDA